MPVEEAFEAPRPVGKGEWPPDYVSVFGWRQQQLRKIRQDPVLRYGALCFYAEHPVEFICHWVDTFDPRLAMVSLPTRLPLVLFERQAQFVHFLLDLLRDQQNGLVDKSRDTGATWLASAFSVWLWLFRPGASIGWGSRKQDLVDKIGDPDSIFEKMRMIIKGLPRFFWPEGLNPDEHLSFMRIINPQTGATITGEAGDQIGRGGRKLCYFKDESAHYEHPESIEAALGDNTNVQIDISTTAGIGTVFDRKLNAGRIWVPGASYEPGQIRVFTLDWSDHPGKTREWYETREKAARDAGLLHVFRQEVDRDPAAALQGVIIPPEWVRAAIDAHIELGFGDEGGWGAALDVADEGGDLHALTFRKGVVLTFANDWGDGDTGAATRLAIHECGQRRPVTVQYDSVGVGAGVKAEANRLSKEGLMPLGVTFAPWSAGASVVRPEERVIPGDRNSPKNKDYYANLKAQGWWELRRRFERVYRMKTEGVMFPASELISMSSKIPKLEQLKRELSQPVMAKDGKLRLVVDKKPEGARSPNLADSMMMNYFPVKMPLVVTQAAINRFAAPAIR